MHEPGRSAKLLRLIRRSFLTADIKAGFALVREVEYGLEMHDEQYAFRQLDEARRVIQNARNLLEGLSHQDAHDFAPRLDELRAAIESLNRRAHTAE